MLQCVAVIEEVPAEGEEKEITTRVVGNISSGDVKWMTDDLAGGTSLGHLNLTAAQVNTNIESEQCLCFSFPRTSLNAYTHARFRAASCWSAWDSKGLAAASQSPR